PADRIGEPLRVGAHYPDGCFAAGAAAEARDHPAGLHHLLYDVWPEHLYRRHELLHAARPGLVRVPQAAGPTRCAELRLDEDGHRGPGLVDVERDCVHTAVADIGVD